MKTRLSILISILVLASGWSVPAWSAFSSKEDMFEHFRRAQIGEFVKIKLIEPQMVWHQFQEDGSVKSEEVKKLIPIKKSKNRGPFLQYNDKINVVPEPYMNYFQSYATVFKVTPIFTYAYKVNDVFLCFSKSKKSFSGRFYKPNTFSECYMFPYKVDDVVDAIKEVK